MLSENQNCPSSTSPQASQHLPVASGGHLWSSRWGFGTHSESNLWVPDPWIKRAHCILLKVGFGVLFDFLGVGKSGAGKAGKDPRKSFYLSPRPDYWKCSRSPDGESMLGLSQGYVWSVIMPTAFQKSPKWSTLFSGHRNSWHVLLGYNSWLSYKAFPYNRGKWITFLVNAINSFCHLVLTAHISFHVGKNPSLMSPKVIIWSKKQHRKFTNDMFHLLNVDRDGPRVANLSWPPPGNGR